MSIPAPADCDQPHDDVAYRRSRIEDARALKAGWFDGDGDPITDIALAAAETFSGDLERIAAAEHWYVAGSEEGGMRFEHTVSDGTDFHCTSVEIDPNGQVFIHCLAVDRNSNTNESGHIETDVDGAAEKAIELRDLVVATLALNIPQPTIPSAIQETP